MPDEPEATEQPTRSPGSLLAESMYDPKPEEPEEPVADPAPEGGEDPDPVAAEGDEPEGGESEASEGGEVEEVELKSLEELAEHFELDPEWMQNLTVTRKVNGKPVQVSIHEAFETLDKVKAADSYLSEAKDKSKAMTAEITEQKEQLTSTIATFSKLLETVESEIDRDVKNIDWAKLRADDPAEYAAKKQEISERRERLDGMKKEAGESYKQTMAMTQQQHEEKLREHIAKERKKLVDAIPELADEEKGEAVRNQITEDLRSRGFNDNEIAQAYDSRLVIMAYEAAQYRKAKAKAGAAKKKVVKVPKVLKPGSKSPEPKANGRDKEDRVSILYG